MRPTGRARCRPGPVDPGRAVAITSEVRAADRPGWNVSFAITAPTRGGSGRAARRSAGRRRRGPGGGVAEAEQDRAASSSCPSRWRRGIPVTRPGRRERRSSTAATGPKRLVRCCTSMVVMPTASAAGLVRSLRCGRPRSRAEASQLSRLGPLHEEVRTCFDGHRGDSLNAPGRGPVGRCQQLAAPSVRLGEPQAFAGWCRGFRARRRPG